MITRRSFLGGCIKALAATCLPAAGLFGVEKPKALFCRVSVQWVPKLEGDTAKAFYGITWGSFSSIILPGGYLQEFSRHAQSRPVA